MKKLFLAVVLLMAVGIVKAEDNILFKLGTVNILLPFSDISATYLFDGRSKRSLVGAETPLIQWKKLQVTGGAVTSVDGEGAPFLGINLLLDNPLANYTSLAGIRPGIFAGRDFNDGEYMVGVKASVSVFN
jgi:hypothetical protein